MIKVITRWWKGGDEAVMKEQLLLSKPVLDRLIEMLEENIQTELGSITSEQSFEYNSYDSRVAFKLGEIRATKKLINLLKVEIQSK